MSPVFPRLALLLLLPIPLAAEPGPIPREYRTDRFGHPLPDGAVARLGIAPPLTGFAWAAGFTAGGTRFVTVDYNGLTVFDAATGRRVETQAVGTEGRSLYTPLTGDGRLLFLLNGRIGVLYDTNTTGTHTFTLPEPFGDPGRKVHSLCLSADCRLLAGLAGSTAWRYDLARDKLAPLIADRDDLHSVRLSPDGKRAFATGGIAEPELTARTVATGKELWTVRLKDIGMVRTVSADGRRLAVADRDGVRVFDAATGKSILFAAVDTTTPASMWGVDLSPDGNRLAIAVDREVTVWDTATGKVKHRLPHAARLVAFAPDGKSLLTVSAWVQRWDVETGRPTYPASLIEKPLAASRLHWSLDGKRLLTVFPGDRRGERPEWKPDVLAVWDVRTMVTVWRTTSELPIREAALDTKGTTVRAFREDSKVHRWTIAPAGETDFELQPAPFKGTLELVDLLSDGRFVAVRYLGTACADVYDAAGKHLSRRVTPLPESSAFQTMSDPAHPGVLVYEDGKRLDLLAGRPLPPLETQDLYHPDGEPLAAGSALVASRARTVRRGSGAVLEPSAPPIYGFVWDAVSGAPVVRLPDRLSGAGPMALSPDGRWFARGYPDGVKAIDLTLLLRTQISPRQFEPGAEWELARRFQCDEVKAMAFSPAGDRLATAQADGTVLIWALTPTRLYRGAGEREADWDRLAESDGATAWAAVWGLLAEPDAAVALLSKRLKPVAASTDTAEQIERLDHPRFPVREAATRELASRGLLVEGDLRAALPKPRSAEQRERIEALLNRLDPTIPPSGDTLRGLRAVWLLERIGTPEAAKLLERLAGGAPGARVTLEAKAALGRLAATR